MIIRCSNNEMHEGKKKRKKERFYHVMRRREMLRLYQKGIGEIERHSWVSAPIQGPFLRSGSFDSTLKEKMSR